MSIYLRALEEDDYLILQKWRNDTEITDLLGGNRLYVSKAREKKWVEEAIKDDKVNLRLGICAIGNDHLLGMVNLINIDHLNRKAEFSIFIGDKNYQGNGYGKLAMEIMIKHGFDELNLNRIWLRVLEHNERAIRLYEKIGFQKEGILRDSVFKGGKYRNMYIMSILADDYYKRKLL